MDTSETYVKMCEKAEEIQKNANDISVLSDKFPDVNSFWAKGNIWLPRQDQLQEMVVKSNYARPERQLIEEFYWFIKFSDLIS